MKTGALCTVRDIYRLIREFEEYFQQKHDLCLNEGMLLCSLKEGKLSSTALADALGLTTSNTSKVIKSVEQKKFIKRILGKEDKRQMYFTLTELGKEKLIKIREEEGEMTGFLNKIGEIPETDD